MCNRNYFGDTVDVGVLEKTKKKLPIQPSFFLFALWFIFVNDITTFIVFGVVIFIHEMGHILMARKLGYKLKSFYIAPYGACLNYQESCFETKDEILIAVAGPMVNLISSVIIISLWWIFPSIFAFTYQFVFQSMMLGLFNLLPCYPLDGGRVLVGLLSQSQPRQKAIKITVIFNIIVSFILFVLFIISCFYNFNPSLCLCAVFMILGILDTKYESKFQILSLYKKKTKNFSKPFFLTINSNVNIGQMLKHIEPSRYTIFIVLSNEKTIYLDEDKVKLLSLRYPLNQTIQEIISDKKR